MSSEVADVLERAAGQAFCAGRSAVAHERTPMRRVGGGWVCAICGEELDDERPVVAALRRAAQKARGER